MVIHPGPLILPHPGVFPSPSTPELLSSSVLRAQRHVRRLYAGLREDCVVLSISGAIVSVVDHIMTGREGSQTYIEETYISHAATNVHPSTMSDMFLPSATQSKSPYSCEDVLKRTSPGCLARPRRLSRRAITLPPAQCVCHLPRTPLSGPRLDVCPLVDRIPSVEPGLTSGVMLPFVICTYSLFDSINTGSARDFIIDFIWCSAIYIDLSARRNW